MIIVVQILNQFVDDGCCHPGQECHEIGTIKGFEVVPSDLGCTLNKKGGSKDCADVWRAQKVDR